MNKIKIGCLLFFLTGSLHAQNSQDTSKQLQQGTNADDPANFLTRTEVFNELQHHENDIYINQTVLRNIIQIGKRFSTRIDIPYVYNSFNSLAEHQPSGIGDISFRLLGFKITENPKAAFTLSMEVSLNTAQSPLLGTGKNLLIPVVSYTRAVPAKKLLFSMLFQQTNSISGDESRPDISFSKVQIILLKHFTRKSWVVLAPEWYFDYVKGGVSMNLRSRFAHAPSPRVNLWVTPSAGIFGDFSARYQWSLDIGSRFFLFRKIYLKERLNKL